MCCALEVLRCMHRALRLALPTSGWRCTLHCSVLLASCGHVDTKGTQGCQFPNRRALTHSLALRACLPGSARPARPCLSSSCRPAGCGRGSAINFACAFQGRSAACTFAPGARYCPRYCRAQRCGVHLAAFPACRTCFPPDFKHCRRLCRAFTS